MTFKNLIKPSIIDLLSEEGMNAYRCEADLVHHLALCLDKTQPLQLGRRNRLARFEEPTVAKYNWTAVDAKSGNIDIFFPHDKTSGQPGTATEINYNYKDRDKIKRDCIKILDPENAYAEAVYFAYGLTLGFHGAVQDGLRMAFQFLTERHSNFVPLHPHILIVEDRLRFGSFRRLWELELTSPLTHGELVWSEIPVIARLRNPTIFRRTK